MRRAIRYLGWAVIAIVGGGYAFFAIRELYLITTGYYVGSEVGFVATVLIVAGILATLLIWLGIRLVMSGRDDPAASDG